MDSSKRVAISELIGELETIKADHGDLAVGGRCLEHGPFERWTLRVINDHEGIPRIVSFWETSTFEQIHGLVVLPETKEVPE